MKPFLDVLIILDALDSEGSFAAASAKLFKTPSALSYTVHRFESELNIQLLDRSGHRATFTRSGQMLLEKGRRVLQTVRELEKQAIKLHEGWENDLVIGIDATFPFSLLTPLIDQFYLKHAVTRLTFIRDVSGDGWSALMQGRADIILGTPTSPPPVSPFGFAKLGELEQIFAVAPEHPLARAPEPLSHQTISQFRAVAVGDETLNSRMPLCPLAQEQDAITVFDFKTKLELQIGGLGCGFVPRYMAQHHLDSGALVEKKVAPQGGPETVWIGWNEEASGLASVWWRNAVLANCAIEAIYKPGAGE